MNLNWTEQRSWYIQTILNYFSMSPSDIEVVNKKEKKVAEPNRRGENELAGKHVILSPPLEYLPGEQCYKIIMYWSNTNSIHSHHACISRLICIATLLEFYNFS